MNEHLASRHELITNLAMVAREMLNNVECGDWKWKDYRSRLNELATGESDREEKHANRNKRLKALCEIVSVFLALVCICGAIILWISVIGGVFKFFGGDIALKEFIVRVLGACAFSSPLIYSAIEGENV